MPISHPEELTPNFLHSHVGFIKKMWERFSTLIWATIKLNLNVSASEKCSSLIRG